jgi:hypothetical protein
MRDPVARRHSTPTRFQRLQFQAGNSRTFQLGKLDLGTCSRPTAHGAPASRACASIDGTDAVSHAALASKRASTCAPRMSQGGADQRVCSDLVRCWPGTWQMCDYTPHVDDYEPVLASLVNSLSSYCSHSALLYRSRPLGWTRPGPPLRRLVVPDRRYPQVRVIRSKLTVTTPFALSAKCCTS